MKQFTKFTKMLRKWNWFMKLTCANLALEHDWDVRHWKHLHYWRKWLIIDVFSAQGWELIMKENICHPLVFGQWETSIFLKKRYVLHRVPLGRSVHFWIGLAHRGHFARPPPCVFYVLRGNCHFSQKCEFQHRKRRCIYVGKEDDAGNIHRQESQNWVRHKHDWS